MPEELDWNDADELAEILQARFPDNDPDQVSDLEIAQWVREIPAFRPGPESGLEPKIAAIRAAWRRAA